MPQAQENVNYLRNSVKATVDAYTGEVTLYQFDDNDPVLKAWNKAFGGNLIKPSAGIPADLREHFRYPEDQFKVQRELLTRFHVTDPKQFYSGQDFWQVPDDPAGKASGAKQAPYYLLAQMPGQDSATFQLTAAMIPRNRQNACPPWSAATTTNTANPNSRCCRYPTATSPHRPRHTRR